MATTIYTQPAAGGNNSPAARLKEWTRKYEKYAGIAIFALGFLWDWLTLTGVDNLTDNLILLGYLAGIGILIVLILRRQCGSLPAAWIQKLEPRFLWVMQFCFGGLFSSYVIFYFQSASFTRTQFFFLILVFLWVGNEFLEEKLNNRALLAALYCFCLFSFLAFFLPVVLASVSAAIFIAAGLLSTLLTLGIFGLGLRRAGEQWRSHMKPVAAWVISTSSAVVILYFANLIPPVPLALKDAGIYHHVARTPAGYEVKYVPPSLPAFWRDWDNPFYYSEGEGVYCYTAVFAPGNVHVPVFHVWSRKTSSGWVQTDRMEIDIRGGRRGGYRGYSVKRRGIAPGKWKVELETERGQTLGRISFTVQPSPSPHPQLVTASR